MLNVIKSLFFWVIVITLVSCGGKNESNPQKNNDSKSIKFNLTANDKMQFNLKSISANEGDFIVINLENIGKMSIETMGHNFILLKQNVDVAKFATKAMSAKKTEYIPMDELDNIIVYSKLIGPGEKTLIEFEAPEKGVYTFLCSFPGHYISMQGKLVVN